MIITAAIAMVGFNAARAQRSGDKPTIASLAVMSAVKHDIADSKSPFADAAVRNSQLSKTLRWSFAGRTQIGWEIYVPLIADTIESDGNVGSARFAAALARWQAKNGIQAAGVLDEPTLGALIRFWQSRRLGRYGTPPEGELVSAPIADFFDRSRDPALLQLERGTYDAYKRMIAAAARDLDTSVRFSPAGELAEGENFLRIVSAYRSPAYQEALRRKEPNAGRGALAKFSAHSTGQALDIYVGGDPVSTKDQNRMLQTQTPVYKWLVKNAHRFGFYNYFYEPWHWEYVPGR